MLVCDICKKEIKNHTKNIVKFQKLGCFDNTYEVCDDCREDIQKFVFALKVKKGYDEDSLASFALPKNPMNPIKFETVSPEPLTLWEKLEKYKRVVRGDEGDRE